MPSPDQTFSTKDKQRSTTAILSIKSSSTSVGFSSFQAALLHQKTLYCKRLQNIGPSIQERGAEEDASVSS